MKNMSNKIITIEKTFTNNLSFYHWMINYLSEKNQLINSSSLIEEFMKRERIGSIEILPGVVLPHVENKNILQSSFYHFELKFHINKWNDDIENVQHVFLMMMRDDEKTEIKKKIRDLMLKEYNLLINN